ncbi:MAG TPA: SpoIID/LytB domain-containing protein, partial [Longimicrobiales bacterium]|nr:SpoIID/LytB domain-containing protein [Longimicrobiales bacterium]
SGIEALDAAGRPAGRWDGVVEVRAAGGGPLTVGERPYGGGALLRRTQDGLTVVNILGLEEYLLGVVPHELGRRPASEIEAVKAQAVAARTYAVGHMGRRESQGFDFLATVSDQVYRGMEVRDSIAERAVRETRGQIVAWQGAPILAYYSSTCGGRTSSVHEVWRRAPLPYLRSVADVDPATGEAWCAFSNRFRWEETWRGGELARILGRTLAAHTGRPVPAADVERAEVLSRTTSERVDTLLLVVGGERYVVRGDSTRWVLRPDSATGRILNSARFELAAEHDGAGHIHTLTARGGGWGHGIGMCQVGAIGRARAGQSHSQLLTAYYQGTDILTLY